MMMEMGLMAYQMIAKTFSIEMVKSSSMYEFLSFVHLLNLTLHITSYLKLDILNL